MIWRTGNRAISREMQNGDSQKRQGHILNTKRLEENTLKRNVLISIPFMLNFTE
jgi:hypothetical protein